MGFQLQLVTAAGTVIEHPGDVGHVDHYRQDGVPSGRFEELVVLLVGRRRDYVLYVFERELGVARSHTRKLFHFFVVVLRPGTHGLSRPAPSFSFHLVADEDGLHFGHEAIGAITVLGQIRQHAAIGVPECLEGPERRLAALRHPTWFDAVTPPLAVFECDEHATISHDLALECTAPDFVSDPEEKGVFRHWDDLREGSGGNEDDRTYVGGNSQEAYARNELGGKHWLTRKFVPGR